MEIYSAVLVLTFGDVVLIKDEGDRDLLKEFAEDFEEALKKAGTCDITVKCILSTQNIDPELESACSNKCPAARNY